MEIFISVERKAHTYSITMPALSEFKLDGPSAKELLIAFPQRLRIFTLNWQKQVDPTTARYQQELPYIQRLKSRGFYQSTAHRFLEVFENSNSDTFDLEFIHRLQRKDYEDFIKSLV